MRIILFRKTFGFFVPILYLLVMVEGALCAQSKTPLEYSRGELRFMWYNVENLFYPMDDTIAGDDEFTPEGVRHWTFLRYRHKLTSLARVIIATGGWEPPEVVGICEIEEARVLEDLVSHPILEPYDYAYVHRESPDHRGMDVACIFRPNRLHLVEWDVFVSNPSTNVVQARDLTSARTRDMIHLCFSRGKHDTVDLFLVHLISKYSGAGATAQFRKNQAMELVGLVDSIHGKRPGSLKVMAGDFNEVWLGYSMEPLRGSKIGKDSIFSVPLLGGAGSYKYKGSWSFIDQFLVVGPTDAFMVTGGVLVIPPLMTADESHGGDKPARTYVGYSYRGGVSDHLPIWLDISRRPFLYPPER